MKRWLLPWSVSRFQIHQVLRVLGYCRYNALSGKNIKLKFQSTHSRLIPNESSESRHKHTIISANTPLWRKHFTSTSNKKPNVSRRRSANHSGTMTVSHFAQTNTSGNPFAIN